LWAVRASLVLRRLPRAEAIKRIGEWSYQDWRWTPLNAGLPAERGVYEAEEGAKEATD
jgi:hypothetical protein